MENLEKKSNFYNFEKCDTLTLYTSEDCNLNCSYCEIAKSKKMLKDKSLANNQKIKTSLIDGSFLNNILKSCDKLNINKEKIMALELWGQEPTLTIDAFKVMAPSLMSYFPSTHSLFFSTNGVGHINELFEFLENFDKIEFNKNQKTINGKFQVRIQFSYDGFYSTKNYRGIDPDIILNNIRLFIDYLNRAYFYNIEVNLSFHNVISRGLIKELNSKEKIKEYWQELKDLSLEFQSKSTNPSVKTSHFACGIENPVNASSEEGRELYKFYMYSKEVGKELQWDSMYGMVGQNLHAIRMAERGYRRYYDLSKNDKFAIVDNDKFIQNILYLTMLAPLNDNSRLLIQRLSDVYCVAFRNGLKLRYNGDYVHCQNCIHQIDENNFDKKTTEQLNAKYMSKNKFYPNLVEDEYKEFNKRHHHIEIGANSSFCHNFNEVLNLMFLLLEAKQINDSYKNREKMLRHAFYLTFMNTCLDDELKTANSIVSRFPGHIRFYCNGFLDEIENYHLKRLKKNNNIVLPEDCAYPQEGQNIKIGSED